MMKIIATPSTAEWQVHEPDGQRGHGLRQLWGARELVYLLGWRDFKVRYKQTILGAAWAVVQPAMMMVVFTFLFGRLAQVPSAGLPYPVFAILGLLPWQLFASGLAQVSDSLVANERLLTRTAFPRLVIPVAAIATPLVDFAVGLLLLAAVLLFFGVGPAPTVVLLPIVALLAAGAALGVGLWLAALNIRYRDVRYMIPFIVQPLLFLTPVAYPAALVPDTWRWVYALNPMVGVVEAFRWAALGVGEPPLALLGISLAVTVTLTAGGIRFFRRVERHFADYA
jgi:lipopolysaccharide transport system permease protein